jgi:HAD superfamily hydrolase (TIGR01509 family)
MSRMAPPDWSRRRVWVFDLDGTLTVPVHDFAYARQVLEIPQGQDILATLAERSDGERRRAEDWLRTWELELADRACLQSDAEALLNRLFAAGCQVGVLTRNTRSVALRTLDAIHLLPRLDPNAVLGRDSAPPKPDPTGLRVLLNHFSGSGQDAVMVGDYLHDVRAGRAAGTATVLVRRHGEVGWEDEADLVVDALWPLDARLPPG